MSEIPSTSLQLPIWAIDRLQAVKSVQAELQHLKIIDVLRTVPDKRVVLTAEFWGRDVVIRLHKNIEAKEAQTEWDEYQRAWAHMNIGPYRIAEPILEVAAFGLIIVAFVPGTPVLQHMWKHKIAERTAYLMPAAEWLRRYTKPTEHLEPPSYDYWLMRAEQVADSHAPSDITPYRSQIVEELRRIAAKSTAKSWRHAICHGDYHPNNLIYSDGIYTGVDIGGSFHLPVCKDIARYLVHLSRHYRRKMGAKIYGADSLALSAFVMAFEITEEEQEHTLPFLLGVENLQRYEAVDPNADKIERTIAHYKALADDLRQV